MFVMFDLRFVLYCLSQTLKGRSEGGREGRRIGVKEGWREDRNEGGRKG